MRLQSWIVFSRRFSTASFLAHMRTPLYRLASRVIVAAVLMLTQLRPILYAGFLHLVRSSC
jgi:hypothetical protein